MFAVYESGTGNLVSTASIVPDTLPDNLSSKDVGDVTGKMWDVQSLSFIDPPASRLIQLDDFVARFLDAEKAAFFGHLADNSLSMSVHQNIDVLIWRLNRQTDIDLDSTSIVNGMAFLESVGVLSTGRKELILA